MYSLVSFFSLTRYRLLSLYIYFFFVFVTYIMLKIANKINTKQHITSKYCLLSTATQTPKLH